METLNKTIMSQAGREIFWKVQRPGAEAKGYTYASNASTSALRPNRSMIWSGLSGDTKRKGKEPSRCKNIAVNKVTDVEQIQREQDKVWKRLVDASQSVYNDSFLFNTLNVGAAA